MRYTVVAPVLFTFVLLSTGDACAQSVFLTSPAQQAGARLLHAVRIEGERPDVDGRLDEPIWEHAPVASGFVQREPDPGAAASQRTEVRILYDDQALYVAARLHDSRPDSIVGRLARRDENVYSDWFSIALDSYHDRRTAFVFATNPRGVKRDLMLYDDTREDVGWDGVWDVATHRDSLGWSAEFRIPLSQLRFSPGAGERSWGVNFSRKIARRDELAYWSPVPPDAAGLVSVFGELRGLRDLRPPRRLEVQPYSVARLTREPGTADDPYYRQNDLFGSAGADLRYGVTSDLTLTATLNPDFGQVEADPSEVNLSAFESYLEEKRPFFTEGSDIFQVGWPEIFHSRRIGRAPQGSAPDSAVFSDTPEATTILGAVKLTGKIASGWSIGVLNALTAAEDVRYVDAAGDEHRREVEPLTNYAVARVVRDFRGGQSAVGAIFTATNRRLEDRDHVRLLRSSAYAGGLDARHRFGGGMYRITGSVLGSYIAGSDSAIARVQRASGHYFQRPDADHLQFDPGLTSLAGYMAKLGIGKIGGGHWRWSLSASATSPGFEINDLGFGLGADALYQRSMVGYEQFQPGRFFRRWTLNVGQVSEWSFGGERKDAAADAYFDYQLLNQWGGSVWYMRHIGGLTPTALRGGPALVYPGRHMGSFNLHSDRRKPLTVQVGSFWEVEDGTGSREIRPNLTVGLRPSDRVAFSLRPSVGWNRNTWQYVGARRFSGQTVYLLSRLDQTTTALTARLDYTFTPTLSLQLYAQPFGSAGEYSDFMEVKTPRGERFADRFRIFSPAEIAEKSATNHERRYEVDVDGDHTPDFTFANPDFNVRQLRSNAVLRWEYRPGSTLFVVWSQGRTDDTVEGDFSLRNDTQRLLEAPGTHTLLVKLSYWLGM
jgi:hypothetical protein